VQQSAKAKVVMQYMASRAKRLGQPRPTIPLVLSTLAAVGCTPLQSDSTIRRQFAAIVRLIPRLIPRLRFEV
jgi:hypothetical protein